MRKYLFTLIFIFLGYIQTLLAQHNPANYHIENKYRNYILNEGFKNNTQNWPVDFASTSEEGFIIPVSKSKKYVLKEIPIGENYNYDFEAGIKSDEESHLVAGLLIFNFKNDKNYYYFGTENDTIKIGYFIDGYDNPFHFAVSAITDADIQKKIRENFARYAATYDFGKLTEFRHKKFTVRKYGDWFYYFINEVFITKMPVMKFMKSNVFGFQNPGTIPIAIKFFDVYLIGEKPFTFECGKGLYWKEFNKHRIARDFIELAKINVTIPYSSKKTNSEFEAVGKTELKNDLLIYESFSDEFIRWAYIPLTTDNKRGIYRNNGSEPVKIKEYLIEIEFELKIETHSAFSFMIKCNATPDDKGQQINLFSSSNYECVTSLYEFNEKGSVVLLEGMYNERYKPGKNKLSIAVNSYHYPKTIEYYLNDKLLWVDRRTIWEGKSENEKYGGGLEISTFGIGTLKISSFKVFEPLD